MFIIKVYFLSIKPLLHMFSNDFCSTSFLKWHKIKVFGFFDTISQFVNIIATNNTAKIIQLTNQLFLIMNMFSTFYSI